jgi:hypothetical protein
LYGQAILGQTPCFSVLPETISIPPAVSAQLSSLSSMLAATATNSHPTTINVVVNQVFALSLPLTKTQKSTALSKGAKIGIGLGAAFGVLFALILCIWLVHMKRHKAQENTAAAPPPQMQIPSQSQTMYENEYRKSVSPVHSPVSTPWQIDAAHQSYLGPQQQTGWQSPPPLQQQQPQQSYFRMPPQRFGEDRVAMPTPGSISPPLYSPPPELSGESRAVFELRAGTPAQHPGWS